ncbi:MAG TPA: 2-amino-4-hydroxy-6-hydroxymethyldihydropteridine diphosphokinase [Gemmatimonadales bacterium]|nr:2-amino-4-hydroxy-6-hydroxymethyldihydropteridine diphosphokinase [Gemmatimonadales bacterium]
MSRPVRAFVALGSNVGDRHGQLARARAAIGVLPGTCIVAESRVEETAPLGDIPQGPYLNQMVLIETELPPRELLHSLLDIERASGRVRGTRWGPRTLDLDIVRYGELILAEPGLTLPHPGFADRDFWQRELKELDPDAR